MWSCMYTETRAGLLPHNCGWSSFSQSPCLLSQHHASETHVAKTLDAISPCSKQLLLFLFITDIPLPFIFSISFIFVVSLPQTPSLFFFLLFYCFSSLLPLQENQRMQQKIDTMSKEVFDLQETLLWKDTSIRVWGGIGLWSSAHSLMKNRPT